MNEQNMDETKKRKIDWWIYSIPFLIILTLSFFFIVQSRPGSLGVVVFYFAPILITIFSIVFLLIGIIRSIIKRPFYSRWRISGFSFLILLCFSGNIYTKYPSSYDNYKSRVEFRLPLDTAITIAWGGGDEKLNYHVAYPNQCWAYDMIVLNGSATHSGDSTKLENYFAYGLPVLSLCRGKIVYTVDSFPDMPIGVLGGGGIKNPEGNQIIIEVAPKEYLILCHLKPNSIKVKVDDSVEQGQRLALLGNSGNTSEPHIHIHLQNGMDDFISEGIPLYFHNYRTKGKLVSKGIPTGGIGDNGNWAGQTVQNVKQE